MPGPLAQRAVHFEPLVMWCKHCRQDTPSISTASRHGMCCGRCGVPLSGEPEKTAEPETHPSQDPHPAEVGLDLDGPPIGAAAKLADWQFDESVRSLQARIEPWKSGRSARRQARPASRQPEWRLDAAHGAVPRYHKKPQRRAADAAGRSPTFTNSALLLGLLATVGGVAVLGWSVVEARGELWNVGLSSTVAGGVVFLLGMVLQLERIWHNSRLAMSKLRQIDSHLQDLERTTASLGVTHGSASQTFYAHMAEQAHPHLMLADLKGQIDMLAMNLARR